jgi:hypothetical protein
MGDAVTGGHVGAARSGAGSGTKPEPAPAYSSRTSERKPADDVCAEVDGVAADARIDHNPVDLEPDGLELKFLCVLWLCAKLAMPIGVPASGRDCGVLFQQVPPATRTWFVSCWSRSVPSARLQPRPHGCCSSLCF